MPSTSCGGNSGGGPLQGSGTCHNPSAVMIATAKLASASAWPATATQRIRTRRRRLIRSKAGRGSGGVIRFGEFTGRSPPAGAQGFLDEDRPSAWRKPAPSERKEREQSSVVDLKFPSFRWQPRLGTSNPNRTKFQRVASVLSNPKFAQARPEIQRISDAAH